MYLTVLDSAKAWQTGFQDPATPLMEAIIDFHNHILFFSIRRTLNSEDSKIRLTPAPSEANIAIKYVLEGEDMVKIGSKYGENSIPMISFFLEKQRELGIPIIIPMGKNSNNPKQPNFQTLEHFERNSIL